jgi:hypothetical protein
MRVAAAWGNGDERRSVQKDIRSTLDCQVLLFTVTSGEENSAAVDAYGFCLTAKNLL